jgi:hypothetical protein
MTNGLRPGGHSTEELSTDRLSIELFVEFLFEAFVVIICLYTLINN